MCKNANVVCGTSTVEIDAGCSSFIHCTVRYDEERFSCCLAHRRYFQVCTEAGYTAAASRRVAASVPTPRRPSRQSTPLQQLKVLRLSLHTADAGIFLHQLLCRCLPVVDYLMQGELISKGQVFNRADRLAN